RLLSACLGSENGVAHHHAMLQANACHRGSCGVRCCRFVAARMLSAGEQRRAPDPRLGPRPEEGDQGAGEEVPLVPWLCFRRRMAIVAPLRSPSAPIAKNAPDSRPPPVTTPAASATTDAP